MKYHVYVQFLVEADDRVSARAEVESEISGVVSPTDSTIVPRIIEAEVDRTEKADV